MAEAGKRKSRRLLRGMIYLLGLGTLLGLLAFFLRIWSWEPSDLSKELLLETGRVFRCELQVQKTELRMFPFPRVFWHGASLSWGENVHAQVKALRVGPDFLSMAIGRIRISYLELDGLGATDEPWRKLLVGLRESMEKNLQAPFLDLRLSSARVEIKLGAEQLLLLSNFNGRLNRKLSGVDLRLGFDVEGPGKGMPLKGVVLEFSASGNLISAYKGRIRAQEPLLDLTTELRGLSHQGFDELLLASPSLDLASARSLLQVLGKALPVPSEVWERLEKGKLLNLELKIPGGSLGTLWENPGAELRGRLQEGKLLLPGPWGVLQDLEAGFKISGAHWSFPPSGPRRLPEASRAAL